MPAEDDGQFLDHAELSNGSRYGFPALLQELANQGVPARQVFDLAGVDEDLDELDYQQRLAVFRAAARLCKRADTALRAGQRQQVSFYGAYGYAMAMSDTLADAWRVGRDFFRLSGSMFRISLDIKQESSLGVWRSYHPESLGAVLPFVAEYWRSSQLRLFSLILGRTFPSRRMTFPYPAPKHASVYREVLGCPVQFASDVMEWHFDAAVLEDRCARAVPDVAQLCEVYCEAFVRRSGGKSLFQQEVLRACVRNLAAARVQAPVIASELEVSTRTFYRRLADEGVSYQTLLDQLRASVASEYLKNTDLPVDEIATRCGYQDVANFRKAFRRWTSSSPTRFREGDH